MSDILHLGPTRQTLCVDDAVPTAGGQGYGLDAIYLMEPNDVDRFPGDVKRLRVEIHRDFYDRQSRYRVSYWTSDGWTEVARIGGEDGRVAAMPSYGAWLTRPDDCKRAVLRVADRLLATAEKVLFP